MTRQDMAELQQLVMDDPETRNDRFTRSWLLNARLEAGRTATASEVDMIRDNMEMIVTGPDYLRRTAARIAATQGAWHLCNRVVAASLR